jgi:hypothetical protein
MYANIFELCTRHHNGYGYNAEFRICVIPLTEISEEISMAAETNGHCFRLADVENGEDEFEFEKIDGVPTDIRDYEETEGSYSLPYQPLFQNTASRISYELALKYASESYSFD